MARFGCYCGAALSNTYDPRSNIINIMSVYKKADVCAALNCLSDIRLFDLETNWYDGAHEKNEEYWYCRRCKRFYVVRDREEKLIYRRLLDQEVSAASRLVPPFWEELYIFSAIQLYNATEANEDITLKDFLAMSHRYRYLLSPDQETAYVVHAASGRVEFIYVLEEKR